MSHFTRLLGGGGVAAGPLASASRGGRTQSRDRSAARAAAIPGWIEALLIGSVSRVVSILAVYVAAARVEWFHLHPSPAGPGFGAWDGAWYLWIARHGYHAEPVVRTVYGPGYHDFAFFPFWPGLIKALSLGDPTRYEHVAPIAANLLFVVAAVLIHRVLERAFGRTAARWGLLFLAFGPSAYVYSLGYGEPLFLVLAGLFFLAGPRLRPMLGGMAMLTRLSGGVLAMAGVADLLHPGTRRRGLAIVAGVVGSFALWWLFIARLTGNFWGYMLGTPSWYDAGSIPGRRPTGIDAFLKAEDPTAAYVFAFMLVLLAGGLAIVRFAGSRRGPFGEANDGPDDDADGRRAVSDDLRLRRLELGLFALGCFASAMLATWSTMPRLASVGFPAFAGVAATLPSTRWRVLAFVAIAALGLFFTGQAMTLEYTP